MKNLNFDDNVVSVFKEVVDGSVTLSRNLSELQSEISLLIQSFDKLARSSEDTFKGIFDHLNDNIGNFANILAVLDSDTLKPLTETLSQHLAKTAIDLSSSISVAGNSAVGTAAQTGLLSSALALAKTAMIVFNTVLLSNPIFLVVAALTAMALGVVALTKFLDNSSAGAKAFNQRMEEAKKRIDDLKQAMDDSESSYQKRTDGFESQAGAAKILADKVFELAEKENKSAEEKQLLLAMTEQLNQAVPGLNLLYDEQADTLNRTTEQVYGLIEANKKDAAWRGAVAA